MPGTRSTKQLPGGAATVQLDQVLTAVGASDWVLLAGTVQVQCTGVATDVMLLVERSTSDPAVGANPAQVGAPVTGNPSGGIGVLSFEEAAAAWWRVRVTSLAGASVAIAIGGRAVSTPAPIAQDRTPLPQLSRLRLSTLAAVAGSVFTAEVEGRTAGSELRLSQNPGGRWSLVGTTLTGRGLRRGTEMPSVVELPGTSGAQGPRETEFRVAVAHDPSVPPFRLPGSIAPLVTFYGDSRTAQGFTAASNYYAFGGNQAAAWALPQSGHRFRVDGPPPAGRWQHGVNSDTTTMMLARVAEVVADPAPIVVFLGGINDGGAGAAVSTTIANITAILQALTDAGKTVVLADEIPKAGGTVQADRDRHEWLANVAPTLFPRVYRWRTWDAMLDLATGAGGTGTYAAKPGVFTDGNIHPNAVGAFFLGQALADTLALILPPTNLARPWSPGEVTDTPALNANPACVGEGGTLGANLQAGSKVATGYTLSHPLAGAIVVASKETIDGIEWQRIDWSGTPAANAIIDFTPTAKPALLAGQKVDVRARVRQVAGSAAQGISMVSSGNGTIRPRGYSSLTATGSTNGAPTEAFDMLMRAPEATLAANGNGDAKLEIRLPGGVPAAGTIYVSQFAMRLA